VSSAFPATTGGTALMGNISALVYYESRVANATGNTGLYRSIVVANARM
jgi:hypothetical protein